MKLGLAAQFVIGSTVFSETKSFLEKLGLQKKEEGISPSNEQFALYTDGRANILLNETNHYDYSGIIYFTPDLESVVEKLEEAGISVTIQKGEGTIRSAFFLTKDRIPVNIVQAKMKQDTNPFGQSLVDIGAFGEYSIQVGDLDESIGYWNKLGFDTLFRDDKWNFAILSDGLIVLGLHSHDMGGVKTALTYFNPNMASTVDKLKAKGITFASLEEYEVDGKPAVDLTTIAPGGQVFFLFTGDVTGMPKT